MANKHGLINVYPVFSKLDLEQRHFVNHFLAQFEPYSDFNFLSLFSWNVDGSTELSMLNDNLIIRLPDYIDGAPVMSILGKTNLEESLKTLMDSGVACKLIPQEVVADVGEAFTRVLVEDEDHHDYIFELKEHAELPGKKFSGKRKKIRNFLKTYGNDLQVREFSLERNHQKTAELLHVFEQWALHREKDNEEVGNERQAIIRLLENGHHFAINCYEILINGQIVGFSINEKVSPDYINCHFQKTLLKFRNIDVFFTNYVAKELLATGCSYINWEQDLGVPGLRHLKRSYYPVKYLKKYAIDLPKHEPTHL